MKPKKKDSAMAIVKALSRLVGPGMAAGERWAASEDERLAGFSKEALPIWNRARALVRAERKRKEGKP